MNDESSHDLATARLIAAINNLYIDAGKPSSRRIAAATGLSHTTVNHYVRGTLPGGMQWGTLRPIVDYLDGDVDHFRRLWKTTLPDSRTPDNNPDDRPWLVTLTYEGKVAAPGSWEAIQALKAIIGVGDTGGLLVEVHARAIHDRGITMIPTETPDEK